MTGLSSAAQAVWCAHEQVLGDECVLTATDMKALAIHLRAARRPKPPSLKEQALMALEDGDLGPGASLTPVEVCIIRRALEALDD